MSASLVEAGKRVPTRGSMIFIPSHALSSGNDFCNSFNRGTKDRSLVFSRASTANTFVKGSWLLDWMRASNLLILVLLLDLLRARTAEICTWNESLFINLFSMDSFIGMSRR